MKVKVGDTIRILAGKDKGKDGKVIKTLKNENKVVVEGLNIVKRHSKPRTTNESGGIFDIEAPIHVSNVKVIDASLAKKTSKAASAKTKKIEEAKVEEVKKPAKKAPAKKTTTKSSSKKASK